MAIKGLSVNRRDVYQDIDLEELTGFDFSGRQDLLLYTGQRMIDVILDRTQKKNQDVNGKAFAPYSASYKSSPEYEAYGKNSSVDMTLSEGMLGSIDFEIRGRSSIRLYFNDPDEADKAYGHITGMRGHKFLDGKTPKREFFGVTEEEFKSQILPDIEGEFAPLEGAELLTFEGLFGTSNPSDLTDLLAGLFNEEL